LDLQRDGTVWAVAYAIKKKPTASKKPNTANIVGIHRMLCKFIVVPPVELTLLETEWGAYLITNRKMRAVEKDLE
jgi:hypothetical protein